jgi:uncharacterized membrane protein YhaH (DUF805 family)
MMFTDISILAQSEGEGGGVIGLFISLLYLAVVVAVLIGYWKLFEKAGKPGWGAIIPIYNVILLLEMVGKPIWWIVLFLIPMVNFVVLILVGLELAKRFGQSAGFGIGLALLPFIFAPLLGFGDAKYDAQAAPAT